MLPLRHSLAEMLRMRVADFMSREVVTVRPDTPILIAARQMLEQKISGLPVVDDAGRVVGIVTERDLLRHGETEGVKRRPHWLQLIVERGGLADEAGRFHARTVGDVMTHNPVTVTEATPLEEASRLIEENSFKRLPVVRGRELVGIIARADLVQALIRAIRTATEVAERDASLKSRLIELERQELLHRARSPR
jgi:CBS domain-containing protein